MTRKEDLEGYVRDSYDLIRQYEDTLRLSDRPKEKARSRRNIEEQWDLIGEYLSEYLSLRRRVDSPMPADVREIAARFESVSDGTPPLDTVEFPTVSQSRGTTYVTHIEHAQGIAIGDGAQVVQQESRAPQGAAQPTVNVKLLAEVVPTAFCHQLTAEDFPLVTVALDNTGKGCTNCAVRVSTVIEDYSDSAVVSTDVSQGELARASLLPRLKPAAVAALNDLRPATLRIKVEQTSPSTRLLCDRTEDIHLHARDTALLAIRALDGSYVDLTDYLAAWVTPRHAEIEKLLRRAAEHHPEGQFVGYQGASTLAQGADIVRNQAKAVFTVLKEDIDLAYINSPLNLGKQQGQITQRVRLPSESLEAGGSANCIDGTVLFASLLELASIDPLIAVVPGHAFLGWRIWRGVDHYEFLETTMIGSADFAAAQQAAQDQYDEVLMKGYFSRGLFDPGGFARLIDVAACRTREIYPLE